MDLERLAQHLHKRRAVVQSDINRLQARVARSTKLLWVGVVLFVILTIASVVGDVAVDLGHVMVGAAWASITALHYADKHLLELLKAELAGLDETLSTPYPRPS